MPVHAGFHNEWNRKTSKVLTVSAYADQPRSLRYLGVLARAGVPTSVLAPGEHPPSLSLVIVDHPEVDDAQVRRHFVKMIVPEEQIITKCCLVIGATSDRVCLKRNIAILGTYRELVRWLDTETIDLPFPVRGRQCTSYRRSVDRYRRVRNMTALRYSWTIPEGVTSALKKSIRGRRRAKGERNFPVSSPFIRLS